MTVRSRFISSVIAAAKTNETRPAFARGAARQNMIARRARHGEPDTASKRASA